MLRIQITIPAEAMEMLLALAERERRSFRDQAGVILTEVLKRRQEQALRRRAVQREREVALVAS